MSEATFETAAAAIATEFALSPGAQVPAEIATTVATRLDEARTINGVAQQ